MNHEWYVGRGKARSGITLKPADRGALRYHCRPGVELLFLTDLWVPSAARRRGYGHMLMLGATEWAKGAGVDLWLYCSPHDGGPGVKVLAQFYAQYGFKRVAYRSPDYEMILRC